jgi:hypothetical protein
MSRLKSVEMESMFVGRGARGRLAARLATEEKSMGSAADSISHQEDSQNPPRKVSDPNLVEGEKTTANDIGQFATLDGGFHLRGLG